MDFSTVEIQTYDHNGNRVLIGDGDIVQAFDARTSGTVGVWTCETETGWTKDDRDFTDARAWRAAVDEILAAN